MLRRMSWLIAAMSVLVVVIAAGSSGAASIPSGTRTLAQNSLEPVYNDEQAGQIGYIMRPEHTAQPVNSNPTAWAPFYLVIYPVGSTAASTYLCMHLPVDNCPSHGPGAAAFAQATYPTVYGAGVIGHDHLMDFPGGSDFNIAWEPMFVLFTPQGAADGHQPARPHGRADRRAGCERRREGVPAPNADLHLRLGAGEALRHGNAGRAVRASKREPSGARELARAPREEGASA